MAAVGRLTCNLNKISNLATPRKRDKPSATATKDITLGKKALISVVFPS